MGIVVLADSSETIRTHTPHTLGRVSGGTLSQFYFCCYFVVCVCYLLFLSLLFCFLHADWARGAPRSSVKRLSVKKIKKTRDEEDGKKRKTQEEETNEKIPLLEHF